VRALNRLPAIVALFLLICVGCGGGGLSLVVFTYSTDWTGGLASLSQRIRLTDPLTGEFAERLINNDTGSLQAIDFSPMRAKSYAITVTLYSQPNGNGSVLGLIGDLFSLRSSNKIYSTQVVGQASSVTVSPASASLQVNRSLRLYAVAKHANGKTLFTPPGAFNWQALNGFASVNSEGIVIGVAQGQAVIRATDTGSGLQNTSVIDVTPVSTTTSKWTILVFMNAANDLDQFSDLNINQMERVANNADVRFVIQWKRVQALGFGAPWTGTRRYRATFDQSTNNSWSGVASELIQDMGGGVDMGNRNTLRDFVNWGMTFYPAERYVVVIWNHGAGWFDDSQKPAGTRGVSFDDEFFTFIKTTELSQALDTTERIDVVSWDSSLMQMMEVGFEIKDRCDFMVGSEESPPVEGLPYDLVFGPLRDNPNQSTESMLEHFGTGMLAFYGNTRKITQSSVRTSQLASLATSLDQLALELIAQQGLWNAEIIAARQEAQAYSPESPSHPHYKDIWHLAFKLKEKIPNAAIDARCDAVMNALDAAVVHEAHNSLSANSHGLSIDFGPSSAPYWPNYSLLAFAVATNWNEWCQIAP
jgi:hypothetical protein